MEYLERKFATINIRKKVCTDRKILSLENFRNNLFERTIRRVFQGNCASSKSTSSASSVDFQKNALERQTIESKHISTISSSIENKNMAYETNHQRKVDTQKSNYGLYALKFNRNEAKANTLKHEYFEPCVNRKIYNRNEFDGKIGFDVSHEHQQNIRKPNEQIQIINNEYYCVISKSNGMNQQRKKRIAPVPPRRKTPIAHNMEKRILNSQVEHGHFKTRSRGRAIIISEC